MTHDGGKTWKAQALPVMGTPNVSTGPNGVQVADAPAFIDQTHGALLLKVRSGHQLVLTTDAGAHWTVRTLPGDVQANANFIDPDRGWLQMAPQSGETTVLLFRTEDAGVTWSRLKTNLPITSKDGYLCSLYFIDQLNGFATRVNGLSNIEQLLRSVDGGRTWTIVGPITRSS